MTAEIAILNTDAVALAADSAVTVNIGGDKKIFPSANKLFMLSKYHPVGIMIYGRASFMDISWEKIIKEYRKHVGLKALLSLPEYSRSFLEFLEANERFYPEKQQEEYFGQSTFYYFTNLRNRIREKIDEQTKNGSELDETEIKRLVTSSVSECETEISSAEMIDVLVNTVVDLPAHLLSNYKQVVDDIHRHIFEAIPMTSNTKRRLKSLPFQLFDKNVEVLPSAGIVIAGFGDDDLFPSVESYLIEGVIAGKLKFSRSNSAAITLANTAAIIPFAQSEMVHSFMEGVDPYYSQTISSKIEVLLDMYKDKIVSFVEMENNNVSQLLKRRLTITNRELVEVLESSLSEWRRTNYSGPIMEVVKSSPKSELAAMAESLMSLTSFKRKVSSDAETVGGPIDVAVISKGDGFIWIKRKHYFAAELNHHFFDNYYMEEKHEEKDH